MFCGSAIVELRGLDKLDTHRVSSMRSMFEGSTIGNIDVSNFDTSNVIDMSRMFNGFATRKIDISNFDTSALEDADEIFQGFDGDIIGLEKMDFTRIKTMRHMFQDCVCINGSVNIDSRAVEDMKQMFRGSKLKNVKIINRKETLRDVREMFAFCDIETVDVSGLNLNNVGTIEGMFMKSKIGHLEGLNKMKVKGLFDATRAFAMCDTDVINITSFDVDNIVIVENMLVDCKARIIMKKNQKNNRKLDLSNLDVAYID